MKEFIGNSLLSKVNLKSKHYDIRDTKLTGFILRVHPTGSMSYQVRVGRNGRVTIGKTSNMTPMQARDKAKEILSQAALGIVPSNKKTDIEFTFYSFIKKEYGPWRVANRKNGKHDLRRIETNFVDLLGSKLLIDITPMVVDRWRTQRINKGVQPSTVNRDIVLLKSCLAKAVEWGIIREHPLKGLKLSKIDNSAKVRYLTSNEEAGLLEALKNRDLRIKRGRENANQWRLKRNYELLPELKDYLFADHLTPMILLSLNTGIRQGELFNIAWEHIDFDKRVMTISGEISKSGRTRHVPLNKNALGTLINWKKQNPDTMFVFTSHKTRDVFDNVRKAWAGILKAAGISKFRWHDMRHHFASKLVMAGVDLNTVRELLGHTDIKMTLRYAHLAPEHKAPLAVEKIV